MKEIPTNVSESTKKRNPHLYQSSTVYADAVIRRIKQRTKPLLNKLEQEWHDYAFAFSLVCVQAITFRLANGVRYTPDFFSFDWPSTGEFNRPTAWEVKGPWATDDAIAKVKMFAMAYPEIRVILVWKDDNKQWCQQRVLA
jgi:hypothetical protein